MAAKVKANYAMSRRRLTGIIILCLLAAAVFVGLDHSSILRSRQYQPKSSDQKAGDFEKYHEKTFTVINVVDGDTFDIDIPDGENKHTRIRLLGVDTPETKHPQSGVMYFGPEASEFTSEATLGKQVKIYLEEQRTRGYYGRLLAYVQLPDGRYLNETLLTEGFAYVDTRFRHSFYNKYQQLESGARSGKKGLWEKVTPEQMPEWHRRGGS